MLHLLIAALVGGCNAPQRMGAPIGVDIPAHEIVLVNEADDASGRVAAYFYRTGSGQWYIQPLIAKVQTTAGGEVHISQKRIAPRNAASAPLIAVSSESAAIVRDFFKAMKVPAGTFNLRSVTIGVCRH